MFHLEWKRRGGAASATVGTVASGEEWIISSISCGNWSERRFP